MVASSWLERVKPNVIINCAAHNGSIRYVTENAATIFDDNLRIVLNLYRAVTHVCPGAIIVHPLSNCSYPGDSDIQREVEWWNGEVHPSVYAPGNSKRFTHAVGRCYFLQHGVETLNFLVPNAFGPGDNVDPSRVHAISGLVIRMIQAKRRGDREFVVWGTGKPIREWGYVEDIARLIRIGVSRRIRSDTPINLGQKKGFAIRESAELVRLAVGFEGELVFDSTWPDGDPKKVLDDTRFRELFPDFRFTEHEEGIERTVRYYESVLGREPQ